MGANESDSSEEESKRSPKGGRRSRLNSMKSDKMKEKLQSSNSIIHKLELEILALLNNGMFTNKSGSPRIGMSPGKDLKKQLSFRTSLNKNSIST